MSARALFRRCIARLAITAGLLAAAAPASATPGWYDAGAGVPSSVSFHAVAVQGSGLVLAVGQDAHPAPGADGMPSPPAAVVYRLANGVWYADSVDSPVGAAGAQLDAVAVANGVAWAVGSYSTTSGTTVTKHALIVRAGGLAGTAPLTWTQVPTTSLAGVPLSIALAASGTSGAQGFVGTDSGALVAIRDDGTTAGIGAAVANKAGSGPIDGVALYGPDGKSGFAVAKYDATGAPPPPRFFAIATGTGGTPSLTPQAAVFDTSTATTDIVDVDAIDAANAVAIDPAGVWQPSSLGVWQRASAKTPAGTNAFGDSQTVLYDVAMAASSSGVLEVVAGATYWGGAIWRFEPTHATWSETLVTPRDTTTQTPVVALRGIAIAGDNDLWAAGDGGTLEHYYDRPDPVTTSSSSGSDTSSGTTSTTSTTATDTAAAPDTSGGGSTPQVVVQQQPATTQPTSSPPAQPKKKHRRKRHRRGTGAPRQTPAQLMSNVAVKRTPKGLLVSFQLAAPAKVAVIAKLGGRVVAKSPARRLRRGPGSVLVPYHGRKVPTQLKVIVRPIAGR